MYRLLAILLVALPLPTNAGEANLSWTPPTQNEDGTPLTDLASYEIWHGCSQSGSYDTVEIVLAPASTHVAAGLPDIGTCYFAAKATNSVGRSSVLSNEAVKVMGILELPGAVTDTAITWAETPPQTNIYSLPETDFTGQHIVAGNWSTPGQSLTIDFEITPRSYPGIIIGKAIGHATQDQYLNLQLRSGKAIRFRLKVDGNTETVHGVFQVPLNVKTVGRAVYDGSQMLLYINGALDSSENVTGDIDVSNDEVWIGANPPDGYSDFDGLISVTVK